MLLAFLEACACSSLAPAGATGCTRAYRAGPWGPASAHWRAILPAAWPAAPAAASLAHRWARVTRAHPLPGEVRRCLAR
jgi:hypothetical protein